MRIKEKHMGYIPDQLFLWLGEPRLKDKNRKFDPLWKGPFVIQQRISITRYVLEEVEPYLEKRGRALYMIAYAEELKRFHEAESEY